MQRLSPDTEERATLLPNGKVLVVGGYNGTPLSSTELYNPTNGTWIATSSLSIARTNHTATLLPNGNVLVAGGENTYDYPSSAELYDPTSGTWATTDSSSIARDYSTATLLPNGNVLFAGGHIPGSYLSSANLFTILDTTLPILQGSSTPTMDVTHPQSAVVSHCEGAQKGEGTKKEKNDRSTRVV